MNDHYDKHGVLIEEGDIIEIDGRGIYEVISHQGELCLPHKNEVLSSFITNNCSVIYLASE